jgi:selenocysteine lyase/cysteine desulfurase
VDEFRAQFPVTEKRIYLAIGALAPAAKSVRSALVEWSDRAAYRPLLNFEDWNESVEELRGRFASLIGAEPEAVAITDNTSRAANVAIGLLAQRRGELVLVDPTTYPSSLFPWLSKTPKRVEASQRELTPESVQQVAKGSLAAVAVSHVAWQTGFRHDLRALSDAVHTQGGVLLVDAAQSAGSIPINVVADGIDVLVTTSAKWLLGVPGVGFLYVNPRLLDSPGPHDVGYLGRSWAGGWDEWPVESLPAPPAGARRFELGVPALPSVAAANAGLAMISSIGVDRLAVHVESLVSTTVGGLGEAGLVVITPPDPAKRGGVIAVKHPQVAELGAYLATAEIDVWRSEGMGLLRVDPAGFNTAADIDRFLEVASAWVSAQQ